MIVYTGGLQQGQQIGPAFVNPAYPYSQMLYPGWYHTAAMGMAGFSAAASVSYIVCLFSHLGTLFYCKSCLQACYCGTMHGKRPIHSTCSGF